MQTLTFTQKLLRQRHFFSSLIPLLALFVGLGSVNTASAQGLGTTINFRRVIVTSGTTAANATTSTYDAVSTTPGPGVFQNTDFGPIDRGAGRLLLQGGEIEIVEGPNQNYPTAFVTYGIKENATLASTGATNVPSLSNTVNLAQTNYNAATRTRTFSLSNAAINILALAQNGGNPGISYRFDIAVGTGQGQNDDGDPIPAILAERRRSVFTATGTPIPDPTIKGNTVVIAPNGGNNVTFYLNSSMTPQFSGANLSSPTNGGTTYDVNTGRLLLNNTTVTTTSTPLAGVEINNVVLYYRTRLSTNPGAAYSSILLQETSNSNGTKTFVLNPSTANQPNLIATPAVIAAGIYNVDIYFQANGTNNGTPFTITDPPTGAYSAQFEVVGQPIAETIWTGSINDNWFDTRNWSNGIPNSTINALIRDLGAGETVPYPNINAGVVVRGAATAGGAPGPILYDNTAFPFAATRNLILGGSSQAQRSITRLVVGRLKVFGDFSNNFASFIQRENTVIEFAGTGVGANGANQIITGGSFFAAEMGGNGNKDLTGAMNISNRLDFTGGVLRTDITRPLASLVVLADRGPLNNQNGGQINGENDVTYLRGFVTTFRQGVLVGEERTYGNMGMTLTFNGTNSPGNVEMTRNTIESYTPLNERYSIRRIFGVRPSDPATNSGGLSATMVFRYRDSETQELNGPNTFTPGTGTIDEANLIIFFSENGGNTFGIIGRDAIDTDANTVTKTGVTRFATITLGDRTRPLPVRLTAFDAKRVGTDALITWETASEQNSRGYDVQVSTTGKEFRTLTSVPSAVPNSTNKIQYRYIDTEANKNGVRYYRLRQVDLDGKETFFNPVAVSFTGKAIETALVAYPNPLNGNEQLHLTFQSANAGKGQISITDMTGRMVRQQPINVTTGTSDLTVEKLGDLKTGMYLVRLTLPSGQVQNLKVVKQ